MPEREQDRIDGLQQIQVQHAGDLRIIVADDQIIEIRRHRHMHRSVARAQQRRGNQLARIRVHHQNRIGVLAQKIQAPARRIPEHVHDLARHVHDLSALVDVRGIDEQAHGRRQVDRMRGRDAQQNRGGPFRGLIHAGINRDLYLRRRGPAGGRKGDALGTGGQRKREIRRARTVGIRDGEGLRHQAGAASVRLEK